MQRQVLKGSGAEIPYKDTKFSGTGHVHRELGEPDLNASMSGKFKKLAKT